MGFLAFLSGPWGALIQKAMMAIVIAGVIWIAFSQYTSHVSHEQELKDQNAQLIQLQKDNQNLANRLNTLSQENIQILAKVGQKNQKVIETHDKVTTYIQSPDGQKSNRPTSDIIRNTIGMLNDE